MDDSKGRAWLAEILVGFSLIGLTAISLYVIHIGDKADATTVMSTVVPLFGTWIGTVLAYYFSRSNFQAAASVYTQRGATPSALSSTIVSAAMIPKEKIQALIAIAAGQTEANIRVQVDLLDRLSAAVTRIPVVDAAGAIKYAIHGSALYEVVYRLTRAAPPPGGAPFDLAAATLEVLLQDPAFRELVSQSFVVVAATATLADAKSAMDAKKNCEDVFVTGDGAATSPIVGWITDVTLASYAKL